MNELPVDEVAGQGGDAMIDEPTLQELKKTAQEIVESGRQGGLFGVRADVESTRLAVWDGQAPDGRKHEAYTDENPDPFEGAADSQMRLADMLVNEDVMLLVLSALRARTIFKGVESTDSRRAGNMGIVLRWVLFNQLGYAYVKELIKLANYYCGDSPAAALMSVDWRKETCLAMKSVSLQDLMKFYVTTAVENAVAAGAVEEVTLKAANQAAADFQEAVSRPNTAEGDMALQAMMQQMFPTVSPGTIKKAVRALKKGEVAEFPMPYVKANGTEIRAKRLFQDVFMRSNTTDFQRAGMYLEPEWVTRADLIGRITEYGYDPEFVYQVVGGKFAGKDYGTGYEAQATFPEWVRTEDGGMKQRDALYYRGLYQICRATYLAVNADGVIGRYYTVFHGSVDVPAHGRRMLRYAHGKYPGHFFQREVLSERVMDSRGLVELSGSNQGLLKLYHDSHGNVAQLSGVPPVLSKGRKNQGDLFIAPMVELQLQRDGDVKWMQPPQYPATIQNMLAQVWSMVNQYHGRPGPDIPPELVQLHREYKVAWFLINLREVHRQILQNCQQYMTEEQLKRITNDEGQQLTASREDIQGEFDIEVMFDPRDFDPEFVRNLATIVKDVLMAMDRDKRIDANVIVEALMWRVMPDLAQRSLRPVDQALQDELADEYENYVEILSGREPEMVTDGSQNYEARLNMYREQEQANPMIYQSLPPDRLAILEARVKHLEAMAMQYGENVDTGRQGAKAALA